MLKAPAGISVDHISFRYPDGKGWIFNDFSHDFKPYFATPESINSIPLIVTSITLPKVTSPIKIRSYCADKKFAEYALFSGRITIL